MDPSPRDVADRGPELPGSGRALVLHDLALAVAASALSLIVLLVSEEAGTRHADPLAVLLLASTGAALLLRRRWPVAVLVAVVSLTTLVLALDYPGGTELPLVMAALYTALAEGHRTAGLAVLALVVASNAGYRLLVEGQSPLLVAVSISPLVLVALLGDGARTRRDLRAEVRARLRALEAEKELETREQLVSERLRTARELHDVLAHTITAIAVQAGAAADGLDEGSQARSDLRSVRATAQEAMHQLQATIEILRSGRSDRPQLAAPDLSGLADLVRGVENTGLDVALEIDGPQRRLPAAIELTAYRIIQEALTNAIRHADAEGAQIGLRFGADELTVTVVDDGRADGAPPPGGGYGLIGMRERAESVGGRLMLSAADSGGFRVTAVLPTSEDPT